MRVEFLPDGRLVADKDDLGVDFLRGHDRAADRVAGRMIAPHRIDRDSHPVLRPGSDRPEPA